MSGVHSSTTLWKNKAFQTAPSDNLREGMKSTPDPPNPDRPNPRNISLPNVLEDLKNRPPPSKPSKPPSSSSTAGATAGASAVSNPAHPFLDPDSEEFRWIPPVNSWREDIPQGLNGDETGKMHTDPITSPADFLKDSADFAILTDQTILDLPPTQAPPRPKRPSRDPKTGDPKPSPSPPPAGKEAFGESEEEREQHSKELFDLWQKVDLRDIESVKAAVVATVLSINEFFYIPEQIAQFVVKGYKGKYDTDEVKNHDREIIKRNLLGIITYILTLYAAFNWMFLFFYTDHYIDMYPLIDLPVFSPVSWIVGPMLTPMMTLNYYLLGKRKEHDFYENYIRPIFNNKPLWYTVFFIVFSVLYQPCSWAYSDSVKKIMNNEPNVLTTIVLIFGIVTYLYSVAFNRAHMFTLQFLFSSFLLVILFHFIMLIFVMIISRAAVFAILSYFTFYSFWPLWVFGKFDTLYDVIPVVKISRIIRDSTSVCVKPANNNVGQTILNFFSQYGFVLYLSGMLFVLIAVAMNNSRQITHPGISALSFLFYAGILILQIYLIIRRFTHKDNLLATIQTNITDPRDIIQSDLTQNHVEEGGVISEVGKMIYDNLVYAWLGLQNVFTPDDDTPTISTGISTFGSKISENASNAANLVQQGINKIPTPFGSKPTTKFTNI